MSINRLKASWENKSQRKFSNRNNAFTLVSDSLSAYDNPSFLKVVSFHGVSGIGKSRLLTEVGSTILSDLDCVSATIDLASPIHSSVLEFFLDLRGQLLAKTPLFDYAAARLLTLSGKSLKQLEPKWLKNSGLLFDFVELAAELADTVAPARLIAKLARRTGVATARYLSDMRDDFQRVDALQEDGLIKYLPYYLGSGIKEHFTATGQRFVVSIDHYDATHDWVPDLVGSSECGIWLIASQDKLHWKKENPAWEPHIAYYALGALSEDDSDQILKSIPIPEADIRSTITRVSGGIPSHIEICANTYLLKKAAGEVVSAHDLDKSMEQMVQIFMSQIDIERQETIKALSILEAFDVYLFRSLIKNLNIRLPSSYFDEFCSSVYVASVGAEYKFFSISPMLREQVLKAVGGSRLEIVMQTLIEEFVETVEDRRYTRGLWLLEELVSLAQKHKQDATGRHALSLVVPGIQLIESGFWDQVLNILGDKAESNLEIEQVASTGLIFNFFRALCLRKQGKLASAEVVYKSLSADEMLFAEHAPLVAYYATHTSHLLGNYSLASAKYSALVNTAPPSVNLLIQRQLADILMLQGNFKDALARFEGLVEANPSDLVWKPETLRFVGHVHRFNFDFARALDAYQQALDIAERINADAMRGKVLTNMLECYCWSSPRAAADLLDEAISLNLDNGNMIEVGKCYSAAAIAYAQIGELLVANDFAEQAVDTQKVTGYRSGILFGLCAVALVAHVLDDSEAFILRIGDATKLSEELGVYGFLVSSLKCVAVGEELDTTVNWLDREVMSANVLDISSKF